MSGVLVIKWLTKLLKTNAISNDCKYSFTHVFKPFLTKCCIFDLFSIYPQRKGKQSNTQNNEEARQEPATFGAMNFGYETGTSNSPQDDGRSKAKVSSTSTEFFLSNVEQAAFGGKDVPVIKISGDSFVDIPDQTKDTKTSDHGLNSYLKKFEQSEMVPRIIRESIKRSIKRFTSQKTKMENY